ncbi:esterase FE4 isoform X1 [Leptinotarsa decemlineata]|uniref:esterase FE4 isoform X1 n=1 Tax=Leptinotarsa decemlineata TaxID=7539 RepID=UPI003D306862
MDSPVVEITEGKLEGSTRTNIDGETFLSFLGIPYGKPPVGELRFKAPQPVQPWMGIRKATEAGNICCQIGSKPGTTKGVEDCLNLNVFTRELFDKEKELKPVMVWIHGGAFVTGSNDPDMFGPDFLLTKDIVLVVVNYRLGLLGFLKLEDTSLDVPGNAGLKDQTLALKWVQRNIKHFGGDPDNVTLFGNSAGSCSVHFHLLSQCDEGLFHKVILQSGVALNHWSLGAGQQVFDFIESMGKKANTEKEVLEILNSLPVEEVVFEQVKYFYGKLKMIAPVLEKPNPTAIITTHPEELITSGNYHKMPIMIGYNSGEGLLFGEQKTFCILARRLLSGNNLRTNVESLLSYFLNLDMNNPTLGTMSKKLTDFYFRMGDITEIFQFITDFYFVYGITKCAKMHARSQEHPVYLYRMSLDAGLNYLKKKNKLDHLPGASHADEVGYLFKVKNCMELEKNGLEEVSVRRFVKLWTDFAKYGNPTPDGNDLNILWNPVEKDEMHILDIGEELNMHIDPERDRLKVWNELFEMYSPTFSEPQ